MLKVHGFMFWVSLTFAAIWGLSNLNHGLTFMISNHTFAEDAVFAQIA
jgi:hypothetical protein